MLSPLADYVARLDAAYRDRSYFVGLKARLLAALSLMILVFAPLNTLKLLWVNPPEMSYRLWFNLIFALAAVYSLHGVMKGRLERAGGGLVLISVIPIHLLVLMAPSYPEPVGGLFLIFSFDLILLLFALIFASRRVAVGVLLLIIGSFLIFYFRTLNQETLAGTLRFTANTVMRDGLITLGVFFCVGITLSALIEAAQRRSEEALNETRKVNENLERLVSERTRDLEAATHRANEASQAKGDFLANMSHEIRTPLHGMIASSELLLSQPGLGAGAAENVRIIAESGDLLLKLLGDVLDFSKIEAGRLELETHPFDLSTLVSDSIALLATKAEQSGVKLDFAIPHELARGFVGDKFRLRQILLNLLSNAVKFTPEGGIVELVVTSPDPSATPTTLRFAVSDTGIGMDEMERRRIFQRFSQANPTTAQQYGGTGLGLAISSRLVGAMGSQLEVVSSPGKGSTFHFTLQLQPGNSNPEVTVPQPETIPQLGLHLLIAEDNPINQKILVAQLARMGCQCTVAPNGEEAILALQQLPLPQAVLMDCDMPLLNGWEAARRIRDWAEDPQATPTQLQAAQLPIIALTASISAENRERCAQMGMSDFLSKPVKIGSLLSVLQPLVSVGKD